MLILLMSVLPNILENFRCELICQFGIGDNLRYYKVNDLRSFLTNDVCIALLFFHAFTGCDTTSSFYNHSKLKFFDVWMKCNEKDDVKNLFKELCNEPLRITDNHLKSLMCQCIILNGHHLRISIRKGWMHLMLLQNQICDQYPFQGKV